MEPIPYGKQSIDQADIDSVVEVLQSDFLTSGPKIAEFEQLFSQYVGSKYAVAVSNGTAALHLSALALGVEENSKVITSPITFAASANCIQYCGGEVVFADINKENILLDVESVRRLLESAPKGTYKGIIPVDFAGYPVDIEAFRILADEFGLWIIEDACHAPGASFINSKGVRHFTGDGAYADLTIFSFHPVKHIACGEGGMITTNDKKLYEKLLSLRTHGIVKNEETIEQGGGRWAYDMTDLGYNYRLTDIQCALGISQLKKADQGLQKRREIAMRYDEAFSGSEIQTILPPEGIGHGYHLYVIQVNNRRELYDKLQEANIYAQIHYIPVHTLKYYCSLGFQEGDFPNAESYYEKCISLPMYPGLTMEEQKFVIQKVKEFSK